MKLTKGILCAGCPLEKELGVNSSGPVPAQIVLLGEAPTDVTAGRGDCFSGPEGRTILEAVEEVRQISGEYRALTVHKMYAVSCSGVEWPPKIGAINKCRPLVAQQLKKVNPTAIIALGPVAAKSLGFTFRKYKDIVGLKASYKQDGKQIPVYFALGGFQVAAVRGLYRILTSQIKRAFSDCLKVPTTGETIEGLIAGYIYPKTADEICTAIDYITTYTDISRPADRWPISVDIESNTLRSYKPGAKAIVISLAWDDRQAMSFAYDHPHFPWSQEDLAKINAALCRLWASKKPLILHNAKFDLQFLEGIYGFLLAGFRWDTMLAEHLLDEDKKGYFNLDAVIRVYLPHLAGHKSLIPANIKEESGGEGYLNVPIDVLLQYACLDTDLTRRIMKHQFTRAVRQGFDKQMLSLMSELLVPATRVLGQVEFDGFEVDWDRLELAETQLGNELLKVQARIDELVGRHVDVNSNKVVSDVLFGHYGLPTLKITKGGSKATGKAALLIYAKPPYNNEFAKLVVSFRTISKAKSTFLDGFRNSGATDGRAHGSLHLNGTETGRLSSGGGGKKFIKKLSNYMPKKFPKPPWFKQEGRKRAQLLFCMEMSKAEIDDQLKAGMECYLAEEIALAKAKEDDVDVIQEINSQNISSNMAGVNLKAILVPRGRLPAKWAHIPQPDTDRSNRAIGTLDIKAAEVRVLTCYAPDPNLIEALSIGLTKGDTREPFDIYSYVASDLENYDYDWVNSGREWTQAIEHKCPFVSCKACDFSVKTADDPVFYSVFKGNSCPKCTAPIDTTECACGKAAKKVRQKYKAITLGMMYMKTKFGLAKDLEIPEEEAQTGIDTFFDKYPLVRKYIQDTKNEVDTRGWVETLNGRRRRFPLADLDSATKEKAYREAVNSRIQSLSSDIVLQMGIWLEEEVKRRGGRIRNFVHDSISFELEKPMFIGIGDYLDELAFERLPAKYPWLVVPFAYDLEIGPNYGEGVSLNEFIRQL